MASSSGSSSGARGPEGLASEDPAGGAPAAAGAAGAPPGFEAPGLSRGDVPVLLRPVQSREHAASLIATIGRIGGVSQTTASGHQGTELRLVVHAARPVALASELRRVLHREMRSCSVAEGRFTVVLAQRAARAAQPVAAPKPADLAVPGPIAAATLPSRPSPARPRPAPTAHDAPAPDVMVGALQSLTEVSLLVFDADLRIRAVTGTAHEEFGTGDEQLVGRTVDEALSERDWERFRGACAAALAGTTTVLELDSRSGTARYAHTCSPVRSGTRVVGGMIVTRDVTDRHRDQMLISELREAFELTFDHSPICQALLSPAGRWLRINAALRELLGRDEPSLVGTDAREITHPDDRPGEQALIQDLLAGRRDRYALHKRLLRADGGTVAVHARMSSVRGEDGAVRGLIAQVVETADPWPAPGRRREMR